LFHQLDLLNTVTSFGSFKIPFGTFLVAALVAFVSESTKLHDKISDVFRIRANFDIRWILIPMALLSGAGVNRARLAKISTSRRQLMGEVFYKYASSAQKTVIDKHLITQALTAWSWYWLCIESMVILLVTAAVLAWFLDWPSVSFLLAVILMLRLISLVYRSEANRYADAEVNAILSDATRRTEVNTIFNAL
jgi:hypothetical protein